MKALLQRVSHASVEVDQHLTGEIKQGILLLLGVQKHDDEAIADKCLQKILNYRIFSDDQGKMNLSLNDIQGDLLVVSQFTLAAETAKGLRPGFSSAASPDKAQALYNYFVGQAQQATAASQSHIATGQFAADMKVSLLNDGPVTFLLEF